jgi:hypothetical protein
MTVLQYHRLPVLAHQHRLSSFFFFSLFFFGSDVASFAASEAVGGLTM